MELKIKLSSHIYQQIQEIIDATNLSNKYKKKGATNLTVEDFIKGAILYEIHRIQKYHEIYDKVFNPKATFRNKFEQLRLKHGYSQTYIAEQTGISQVSLSKILNNKGQLRIDSFFKLWVFFECPPLEECIDFIDGD